MTDDPEKPEPSKPKQGDRRQRSLGVVCGAKTRAGGICTQPAMSNGRCRMHGGKAARGIQNGNFKHGRHSQAIRRLADDIEHRVNDPDLLDPRRSIAVHEGVVARLHEMVGDGDGPEFRETVRVMLAEAFELFKDDPAEGAAKLRQLRGYVERGVEKTRALMAVQASAESWNRSQSRFWQSAMASADKVSRAEFVTAMYRIAEIITEEVDRGTAKRILARADREVCGGALGLGGE